MFDYLAREVKSNPRAFLKSIPRLLLIFLEIFTCYLCYLLWFVMLQPLRLLKNNLYWKIEGLAYQAFLTLVSSWISGHGNIVLESGSDISTLLEDNALVIVNHQSPIDILVIMRCLQGKGCISANVMWLMSWIFQFLAFGNVSKCHGDAFILQGSHAKLLASFFKSDLKALKAQQIESMRKNFKNYISLKRKWLIIFPEGGFLRNARIGSQRYASKKGLPRLENVAYPKVIAVQSAVDAIGIVIPSQGSTAHRFERIIDVTLGYKEEPSLLNYIVGHQGPQTVVCHYRVYSALEMIDSKIHKRKDDEQTYIAKWLNERFMEKDKLLTQFYTTGKFPNAREQRICESIRYIPIILIFIWVLLTLALVTLVTQLLLAEHF